MRKNRTAEDARARVMTARTGYLDGPATVEYLTAMRVELRAWLDMCESALAVARTVGIYADSKDDPIGQTLLRAACGGDDE